MAEPKSIPQSDVVFIADGQFEAAAKQLNAAADELTRAVAVFERYILSHGVDVPCWLKVKGWNEPDGEYWKREIGFDSIKGTWCIAIRETHGHQDFPEHTETTRWAFSDAPRKTRISAADKLVLLLQELTKEMQKTSRRLSETAASTSASAEALGLAKPAKK